MKILIVDDERLARAELRRLLAAHADVKIVGEAASAQEAVERIAQLRPDLLLLDVQMPGASGFDLVEALDDPPEVIFTTAFGRYALQAFDVNALDYLQKPIQAARLATALLRAAQRLPSSSAPATVPATPARRLFIRDGERCWFVDVARIRLLESEGNYTRVHFDGERPLTLRSLSQLEERLAPGGAGRFVRASRRHVVNLDHVRAITAGAGGGLQLALADGTTIGVSRRRAALFRALA
ncbi:LytR/AlgR family response regulator transcription factor [Pseudoduganella buxea]|uniref:Response regulator n=1 Tax=Pseudoduganella buxea TaxID=1949069 RepID=A0A6I3T5J2_9BURK|nr:LytTR family DNA-binding domain-containing protein [Pseudoduganella buxea]MTV56006.1 response regulator [Pseudoduganella buxea]GGC19317.1 DNA-binding response regulator [Pseudoduganella buxea]